MHLLAIDTATRRVGVAIGCESGLLGSIELGGAGTEGPPRHAEQLAPAIEYLCAETRVSLEQIAAIAVGVGPGMFTGLRVGVTTAKVLAQALRVPVISVPSLDLIAYPLRHASALVVPVVDARRHEVYYAIYRPLPGGLQRVSEYELATADDVAAELQSRGEEAIVAGDGAARFRSIFSELDRVELAGPSYAVPSLSALVELAAGCYEREQFVPASEVVPMYLRRSDAEIAWERRGA